MEQERLADRIRTIRGETEVPEDPDPEIETYEEFATRGNLLLVRSLLGQAIEILEENNNSRFDREVWERWRPTRIEKYKAAKEFDDFVESPKVCWCGLEASHWHLGGKRDDARIIFECPGGHELRFSFSTFEKKDD